MTSGSRTATASSGAGRTRCRSRKRSRSARSAHKSRSHSRRAGPRPRRGRSRRTAPSRPMISTVPSRGTSRSVANRRRLLGAATLAAGAVAGVALEEALYRRVTRRPDPERDEPIGSVPGTTSWVESFDGTRLYTRTYGPKDATASIIFIHGIVENHVIWHYLVRDLRADGRFRLIAYD